MVDLNEQYLTDRQGKRLAAVIPIAEFERLRELLASRSAAAAVEPDCEDVTTAVVEGLTDVQAGRFVPLVELLSALRG